MNVNGRISSGGDENVLNRCGNDCTTLKIY